jgi:hypothetical protein
VAGEGIVRMTVQVPRSHQVAEAFQRDDATQDAGPIDEGPAVFRVPTCAAERFGRHGLQVHLVDDGVPVEKAWTGMRGVANAEESK